MGTLGSDNRLQMMFTEDEQFTRLVEAATTARSRYIELRLVSVTQSAIPVKEPTPEMLAELTAAEVLCEAADEALAGFQLSQRWAPRRD